jgi:hypothetical protein
VALVLKAALMSVLFPSMGRLEVTNGNCRRKDYSWKRQGDKTAGKKEQDIVTADTQESMVT